MRAALPCVLALAVAAAAAAQEGKVAGTWRAMGRATLEDKVRGGWAGQMIGVAYGAPTEFRSNGRINEAAIDWSPERVGDALQQDDLYVEMTLAEVMDRVGLGATTRQYGERFRDTTYALWHANASARRNLARGLEAPLSGHPRYNVHANDIDFQIESDFIGLMAPGLPRESNRYADRVGRVMNHGDGLYGGLLFGAMYATAFFESDPHRVVEQGLRAIPAGSGYARVIRDVLAWHGQHPSDWRRTWALLEEKWNRDDVCPDGSGTPFNIDARLNGAYVVLGLLYGDGDLGRTMEIATRAGQDSDCNPSSAAGVLGVILGYSRIPDAYKRGIPPIAGVKFEHTQYSFDDIVASTVRRAEKVILSAGGRVTDDAVLVPVQTPEAPPLEQWDSGVPVARVDVTDPAWSWQGDWTTARRRSDDGAAEWSAREAGGPGDEAVLRFEGTGVALVGPMSEEGGRCDVWIDGRRQELMLDAWVPARTHDNDAWHVTGLARGRHTLRLVVRGDADRRSKGRRVALERAIVYGDR